MAPLIHYTQEGIECSLPEDNLTQMTAFSFEKIFFLNTNFLKNNSKNNSKISPFEGGRGHLFKQT